MVDYLLEVVMNNKKNNENSKFDDNLTWDMKDSVNKE